MIVHCTCYHILCLNILVCVSLAALGLRCSCGLCLALGGGGFSRCDHGLRVTGAQRLWRAGRLLRSPQDLPGPRAPGHTSSVAVAGGSVVAQPAGSSRTRARTCTLCTGRWINHWATRIYPFTCQWTFRLFLNRGIL